MAPNGKQGIHVHAEQINYVFSTTLSYQFEVPTLFTRLKIYYTNFYSDLRPRITYFHMLRTVTKSLTSNTTDKLSHSRFLTRK